MPPLPVLSAYAALGLAIALAWLLLSSACAGLVLLARWRRAAGTSLRREPGAYVARRRASVRRRLRRLGTASLLFLVSAGTGVAFGRPDIGINLPDESLATAILALAATCAVYVLATGVSLLREWRALDTLLSAQRRIAQRLEEVQRRGFRVFHAVPLEAGVVDHVVVGTSGVFALQVVLPPKRKAATVSLLRGALAFGPRHGEVSLGPVSRAFAGLARELARLAGHPVRVVPTLVAPGCKVVAQDDMGCLVTNEETCVTLVGWKDTSAYLMDDQVDRICGWLADRCRTAGWPGWRPGQWRAAFARPRMS